MHINQLKKSLESLVYEYVCRSLFKADRLAFALHLAHAMHQEYFQDKVTYFHKKNIFHLYAN